ncbi:amidohydrolase family protein [Winogradskyella flava]|uniref:Amidohydrolase family protein n=1 Tax=Winogradskyella flava TaxID=1884876 RepID=A0A842IW69_9FLAO|nr:amidohydrolase family protein [Winogradskyella flava]MBC2845058.1 amidohydrolase family protein [Winogradskyella flava]
MKKICSLVILAFILCSCGSKTYDLAITNVQLFDAEGKTVIPNQSIWIKGDTIAAITSSSESFTAQKTIDGNNRLVTPGFIDTHVHTVGNYGADALSPEDYKADNGIEMLRDLQAQHYLNYGVTTIIDMGQPEPWIDVTLDWQKNPTPNHPNIFICGGSMVSDEDRRQPAHHIEVMNPEHGREKVRSYAARGLKYMKLYSKLRKPDYEAMADEAKKQGIIINSHVDNNRVTIAEGIDYGVLNFEHFFTLTPSILNYDEHWPKMNDLYGIKMNSSIDEFAAQMVFFFGYIKSNPEYEARLYQLFDKMAREGATLSSAMNVVASSAGQSDFFTSFEYFPIRKTPMVNYTEAQQKQLDSAFESFMNYMKIAHDKGVKLRIGTDCRFGGRAFLSELMLFKNAGFSTGDILQIATLSGYEAMQLDDKRGTIEVGKTADLILFDKNPFDDIKHVLSHKTIIKDGLEFKPKTSIGHELRKVLLDDGVEAGKLWFEEAKQNNTYPKVKVSELKNTVRELFTGGKTIEAIAAYQLFKTEFPDKVYKQDEIAITNASYGMIRNGNLEKLKTYYAFAESNFPDAKKFMGLSVYMAILDKDIAAGQALFKANQLNPQYVVDEDELNGLGYLYLQSDRIKEAIAIFEMNISAFPESSNVYDSLGEAYLEAGHKALAKKNYEKSLALDPDNDNAKTVLKGL